MWHTKLRPRAWRPKHGKNHDFTRENTNTVISIAINIICNTQFSCITTCIRITTCWASCRLRDTRTSGACYYSPLDDVCMYNGLPAPVLPLSICPVCAHDYDAYHCTVKFLYRAEPKETTFIGVEMKHQFAIVESVSKRWLTSSDSFIRSYNNQLAVSAWSSFPKYF